MATKKSEVLDKQIQTLIDEVQSRKAEISKIEKLSWQTNTTFFWKDGDTNVTNSVNIQTTRDIPLLITILGHIISKEADYREASASLGFDFWKLENLKAQFSYGGFVTEQWKADIQSRIQKIAITDKKRELENLEGRLNLLISPERKAELELAAIKKALNK